MAVAVVDSERLAAGPPELRDLLRRILADEVNHARFGWKLVAEVAPSLDAATRERLGRYLAVAFAHLEKHELDHMPPAPAPSAEAEALGLCDTRRTRALFYETAERVIVPGLERLGLPASQAWSDRGARNSCRAAPTTGGENRDRLCGMGAAGAPR
ncbi:MAG: hypothetical protein AABZ30_10380 [Myxococcota bacterium]